ncbi:MAG: glycosyltransferase, partial [Candidatus Odinarchaeota archaeon]
MSFELNDITKDITPGKIVEYMAMKKPVLSTSLPGVMIEIGKDNGVIYAKNQLDLIKKIEKISHNKEKLEEIGRKGYHIIEKYYLWSKILNNFKKIVLNLIKLRRRKKKIKN